MFVSVHKGGDDIQSYHDFVQRIARPRLRALIVSGTHSLDGNSRMYGYGPGKKMMRFLELMPSRRPCWLKVKNLAYNIYRAPSSLIFQVSLSGVSLPMPLCWAAPLQHGMCLWQVLKMAAPEFLRVVIHQWLHPALLHLNYFAAKKHDACRMPLCDNRTYPITFLIASSMIAWLSSYLKAAFFLSHFFLAAPNLNDARQVPHLSLCSR